MSLIWAGGEDMDFTWPTSGFYQLDTGDRYRPGYSRHALTTLAVAGVAKSNPFPGGAVTSCWYSVQFKWLGGIVTSMQFVGLGDSTTTDKGLYIGVSSTSTSKYALGTYDGSTWTELAVESGTSITTSLVKLDMQLINYGATATVNVYLNTALIITFTGDITISGVSGFDPVFVVGSTSSNISVSEHTVCTTDTRSFSLVTQYLNAAGDSNQWGGAYTDINESTLNDATIIYTNTDSQIGLFNLSELPSGSFTVRGSMIAARCTKTSDSSISQVKLGVKSGGTTTVDSGHSPSVATFNSFNRIMDVNPVTSVAFTQSEMGSLQLALESAT